MSQLITFVPKHIALSLRNAFRRVPRSVSALGVASAPHPPLELSFSAINTLQPQCNNWNLVLVLLNGDATKEIGRTKVIADSSTPELSWPENLTVEYCFGVYQLLIIRVYYVHEAFHGYTVKDLKLEDQTLLAEGGCKLSQIVTAKDKIWSFTLKSKQTRWQMGELTVRAKETVKSRIVSLNVKYCPTNPMRERERGIEGQFLKLSTIVNRVPKFIITTEVVKKNLDPEWNVLLTKQELGSKDDKLVIEGYNFCRDNNHKKFGKLKAAVSYLESGKKKVSKGLSVDMSEGFTFLEYHSIYKLGFMVAFKFSGTNGSPNYYLHSDSSCNVIKCVGEAIECYDSHRRFPAWGFGGKTCNQEQSSCFNLNLNPNPNDCEVNNVEGIITAYQSALKKVKLDCNDSASLSEVIKKASDFAEISCSNHYHKYYVLLIIMDGGYFDVQNVIDSVVDASKQPLSILIVGMGDGPDDISFNNLMIRCATNGHLLEDSKGVMALRDTVLCMPKSHLPADEQCMAETLLKGIPKQYCAYMQKMGVKPAG